MSWNDPHRFTKRTNTRKNTSFEWTHETVYDLGAYVRSMGQSLCQLAGRWKRSAKRMPSAVEGQNLSVFMDSLESLAGNTWELRRVVQTELNEVPELDSEQIDEHYHNLRLLKTASEAATGAVKEALLSQMKEIEQEILVDAEISNGTKEVYWDVEQGEDEPVDELGLTERQRRRVHLDENDPITKVGLAYTDRDQEAREWLLDFLRRLVDDDKGRVYHLLNLNFEGLAKELGQQYEFKMPPEDFAFSMSTVIRAFSYYGYHWNKMGDIAKSNFPYWLFKFSASCNRQVGQNKAAYRASDGIWELNSGAKKQVASRLYSATGYDISENTMSHRVGELLSTADREIGRAEDAIFPTNWLASCSDLLTQYDVLGPHLWELHYRTAEDSEKSGIMFMQGNAIGLYEILASAIPGCQQRLDEESEPSFYFDSRNLMPDSAVRGESEIEHFFYRAFEGNYFVKKMFERWDATESHDQVIRESLRHGFSLSGLMRIMREILFEWWAEVELLMYSKDTKARMWVWPDNIDQPICWNPITHDSDLVYSASMTRRSLKDAIEYWEEEGRKNTPTPPHPF